MLQPVLVQPADEDGDYPLTDGNRRILAAAQAGLMEIPALIRETDERTGGLDDALIANLGAVRLNPLEEALGFRRLRDARLTPREIAHRVPGMSERLVRERLRILDLPAELWPKVADKTIPLGAVEALATLAAIHPGLPSVAVGRVLDGPVEQWDAATTWDDVVTDPISVVVGRYERQIDDLPSDVYVGGHSYPLDRFELPEKAAKDLEKLCEFVPGVTPEDFTVRFDRLDEARALGASHTSASGYETLTVGRDVANQLAGDYIAVCLKVQRANARQTAPSSAEENAPGTEEPVDPAEAEAARKEAARRERAEAKAAQEAAATRNEELGWRSSSTSRRPRSTRASSRSSRAPTSPPSSGRSRCAARATGSPAGSSRPSARAAASSAATCRPARPRPRRSSTSPARARQRRSPAGRSR